MCTPWKVPMTFFEYSTWHPGLRNLAKMFKSWGGKVGNTLKKSFMRVSSINRHNISSGTMGEEVRGKSLSEHGNAVLSSSSNYCNDDVEEAGSPAFTAFVIAVAAVTVVFTHHIISKKRSRLDEPRESDSVSLRKAKITHVGDCCACCGIAADDNIKLKTCDACKLARYCSVECQRKHRSKHKQACKKRAAELRDDELFSQPESTHLGECPICCLPLSLDESKSSLNSCCSKFICKGCLYANILREMAASLEQRCVFCRELTTASKEESDKRLMKRIKANDPAALREMGLQCFFDESDFKKAFEYLTKAAGLGDIEAHYNLSCMYGEGRGVEKDIKKNFYHLEKAAIGGHPEARYNLGYYEEKSGRINRAVKHWIIGANLGQNKSLEVLKKCFMKGYASKEEYASALHGHQAAVDATKSQQREKAEWLSLHVFTLGTDPHRAARGIAR